MHLLKFLMNRLFKVFVFGRKLSSLHAIARRTLWWFPLSHVAKCPICVAWVYHSSWLEGLRNCNSLNSQTFSSQTDSSKWLAPTRCCIIHFILARHFSLDPVMHLGSRHYMLLTSWCFTGALFCSFSSIVIKNILHSILTCSTCLTDMFLLDFSRFLWLPCVTAVLEREIQGLYDCSGLLQSFHPIIPVSNIKLKTVWKKTSIIYIL